MKTTRPRTLVSMTLAAAVAVIAALAHPADKPDVEHYASSKGLPSGLPFSEAVRLGDTLYLSGQIGVEPGTMKLVEGGIEAQARQALDNIEAVLKASGHDMNDIVKCTAMLADMKDWSAFNEVYVSYFTPPYPARSAFGARGLAAAARLELECIAAVSD